MEAYKVNLSKQAKKDLQKVPSHIVKKLRLWVRDITTFGLTEVRKTPGYHDEPLHGKRSGQRSIRLNKAYRAIYTEYDNGNVELNYIEIDEVNKHEY
ncbi:MAG: type II toxin-antitoxin system mRNA interferase toxin, RelE/StbE family [Gammaproteobacteria bacterium]|nr:MAG: type II toxin-antitoxin system mRNA interferase toxin, RelE/StbE family [Gammaproteobacteria bacterium]UTW43164.1 type II toxin-antitoxin system mRNA interferase toxin, RelE/StbE family [bacterium SCSIO 12844]